MSVVDIIIEEQNEMKAHKQCFVLWPRQWKKYLDTHNWKIYRLDAIDKERITNRSGAYSLLIQLGIANHPEGPNFRKDQQ